MKILQADDHALFRDGVKSLLRSRASDITILESRDFESTKVLIDENPDCDVVLLDIEMPGMHGLDGLKRLVQHFPGIPVIVLTASEHRLQVQQALKFGAAGFVPKSSPTDILWSAIRLVVAGGIYAPRCTPDQSSPIRKPSDTPRGLTPRQIEILECVSEGLSNKATALRLSLSESTIKGHMRAILQILRVDNRVQAINRAREIGILSLH